MAARFTRQKLDRVLRRTCDRLGLDPAGASVLRFTINVVYALANEPVVVRILASEGLRHRVPKVVTVARHFERFGVAAVRLFGTVDQPLAVEDLLVTVWERVPTSGRPASPTQLARLLHTVHALPVPAGTEQWDPLRDVRSRVADAEDLSAPDRRFLLRRCSEIEGALAELDFPLARGLVHGDAHPGNVIVGPTGPVLCDFDSSCVGPPEWDLIPLAVGGERFGDPTERYRELAEGYGFDVTGWEGYPVLRAARELKLTTGVLPILRSQPRVRQELSQRLSDLRTGRRAATWTRFG